MKSKQNILNFTFKYFLKELNKMKKKNYKPKFYLVFDIEIY